jgi:NitT/TauT family transport system substrate-binding protein
LYAPVRPAGWYIMVPAASPIKTLAQLNGKTVGVTQIGSLTDFWVQETARNAKISVTSVPLGGGVAAGLNAKQADAAILWPLFSYKGLTTGALRSLASLETALPPTISEGVGASLDIINKRPEVLRRWLNATAKALAYMQKNESWTETFLKKYFDDNDDKSIAMVYKDFLMKVNPTGEMHDDWKKTSLELPPSQASVQLPPIGKVFSTAFTPVRIH